MLEAGNPINIYPFLFKTLCRLSQKERSEKPKNCYCTAHQLPNWKIKADGRDGRKEKEETMQWRGGEREELGGGGGGGGDGGMVE